MRRTVEWRGWHALVQRNLCQHRLCILRQQPVAGHGRDNDGGVDRVDADATTAELKRLMPFTARESSATAYDGVSFRLLPAPGAAL